MWLDLRDVIEIPGAVKRFTAELDAGRLCSPSLVGFVSPPVGEGEVRNAAGTLSLRGTVRAEERRVCDRCGREFVRAAALDVNVPLAADLEDPDAFDGFALEGDGVDVSDVLETCFLLEAEGQCLCRDDCRGLCPICGKDLNEGDCSCATPVDPRLAVLGQLLDRNETD